MAPVSRDREQRAAPESDPLPGFTASRARRLAAEWDDDGLWDDVVLLGKRFWAASDPVDRAVRWHHLVLAVGNFKRPRTRWLVPARLDGLPRQQCSTTNSFDTPSGVRVSIDDRTSWEALRESLVGADVSTVAHLLAALWPEHHVAFDWRVRVAASGLRLAGDLSVCPGLAPAVAGGESSPLDFDDYTLVRGWLRAVDIPLIVSQRALYCLSRRAGSDPDRAWPEYARVLRSILDDLD
jgi:hypothetical protein